jgi:hypothetical protein
MVRITAILFAAIILSITSTGQTVKQSPVKPGAITLVAKFKPPTVKSFLGRNTKSANITIEEANQLLSLPLKITDDKNVSYKISSYQFLYKKKSVIENEETGRRETVFTTVADRFKSTPLPAVWINNIAGGLKKDEELFFFDIIVTDKLNRKFFAPDLKIKIQ